MSRLRMNVGGTWYPLATGVPIGRVLEPGASLALFGLDSASADRVLSVDDGAPVNVDRLSIIPHANGTHTESAAHLDRTQPPVCDVLPNGLRPGMVLTVRATRAPEDAPAWTEPGDLVVGLGALNGAVETAAIDPAFLEVLILRVVSAEGPAPWLSPPAAARLRTLGVQHLITHLPSLDRLEDGGRLAAHRAFWDLSGPEHRTITELADIPDSLPDGPVAALIQAPRIRTDAVPSYPVLFPISWTVWPPRSI